jgi:hypothetical protein
MSITAKSTESLVVTMKREKKQIMYVECKAGAGDCGEARICRVRYSKSGRTIYVGEISLQRGSGIRGNYFDAQTGIEYWVSGPKQKGGDRHWAGGGPVLVDPDVVDEYWRDIRMCDPPSDPSRA